MLIQQNSVLLEVHANCYTSSGRYDSAGTICFWDKWLIQLRQHAETKTADVAQLALLIRSHMRARLQQLTC